MIKAIETYLVTDGNGLEAVRFYEAAFEAEVKHVTLWKEAVPDCPPEHEGRLMNAQLDISGNRLQISDENPAHPYTSGGNMTATLVVDTIEEAKRIYDKLSENAIAIHMPIQETFWSPAYANVTDRYGMTWQINTEP